MVVWDGVRASGKRLMAASVRLESQGVREVVDAEEGEGSGVDSKIWTASLSYLLIRVMQYHLSGLAHSSISSSIEKPFRPSQS